MAFFFQNLGQHGGSSIEEVAVTGFTILFSNMTNQTNKKTHEIHANCAKTM